MMFYFPIRCWRGSLAYFSHCLIHCFSYECSACGYATRCCHRLRTRNSGNQRKHKRPVPRGRRGGARNSPVINYLLSPASIGGSFPIARLRRSRAFLLGDDRRAGLVIAHECGTVRGFLPLKRRKWREWRGSREGSNACILGVVRTRGFDKRLG